MVYASKQNFKNVRQDTNFQISRQSRKGIALCSFRNLSDTQVMRFDSGKATFSDEGFKSCLLLIGNYRVMQSCASSIVSHHPDATIPLPQPSSSEIAVNVDAPPGPSSPFLFCRAQKCQAQPFFGSDLFDKRRIFCTLNANISECETSLQPDMRFVVLH